LRSQIDSLIHKWVIVIQIAESKYPQCGYFWRKELYSSSESNL